MADLIDLNGPLSSGVSTARAVLMVGIPSPGGQFVGSIFLGGDFRKDFGSPELTLLESGHRKELPVAAVK